MDVLRYRPVAWVKAFQNEKSTLHFLLPQFRMNVEHVGATSVPGCRSFRNVDILISVSNFSDISTISMLLQTKGYNLIDDNYKCVVLVKKKRVNGERITIRVVEYASQEYLRIVMFKTYLLDRIDNVNKYNIYREKLFADCGRNVIKYNEQKYDYINNHVDEMFKFE